MLQLRSITRSFGGNRVLDDISFDVAPGRMTGFVGANGSGKTTTMRIILGVLAAHGGTVSWQDGPVDGATRRRFGYMPEERGLYPKMKVVEQVAYFARLRGMGQRRARRKAEELLERLDLTERADSNLEELSLGNQQRAQVAVALVHDPALLILDEPFSGLDPLAVEVVLSVLRERAHAGVPVLFSSHQLDVVERLCDDVVIISKGAIAVSGGREDLRERYGAHRYSLQMDGDAGWVRDLPGVRIVELDGPRVVFDLVDGANAPSAERDQVILQEALQRAPVRGFHPVAPSLSEIFTEVLPR